MDIIFLYFLSSAVFVHTLASALNYRCLLDQYVGLGMHNGARECCLHHVKPRP